MDSFCQQTADRRSIEEMAGLAVDASAINPQAEDVLAQRLPLSDVVLSAG